MNWSGIYFGKLTKWSSWLVKVWQFCYLLRHVNLYVVAKNWWVVLVLEIQCQVMFLMKQMIIIIVTTWHTCILCLKSFFTKVLWLGIEDCFTWEKEENIPSHIIDEFTSQTTVFIEEVSNKQNGQNVALLKLPEMIRL